MKDKTILIGGAAVYRRGKEKNKTYWFVVKIGHDSDWELPKTTVRRGESSVRSVIRQMGEQGGMRAKVLEEVGRAGGTASINKRIVPQKFIYYLMMAKGDDNILGFADYEWMEYEKAVRKITLKRDLTMLKDARALLKAIVKAKKSKQV